MNRFCGLCGVLLFVGLTSAGALEVGTGVADITPDVKAFKVPMAGYGARLGRPATGVHDPLHAKVLYMKGGERRMALITCDLRSSTPEFKGQIVQKCADLGLTLDSVFVAGSHTHDGPSMYPEKFWQLQFGAYDPKIVDIMSSSVAKAVHDAARGAAPARIGFGKGKAEGFTRNRRWGYDAEKRKANNEQPVVDPRLFVMRIDGMDGACRAVLVNFASHPTILDDKNMQLSAEWPGVLQREIEKAFPGSTALFLNGAEGDQSPAGATGGDEFARVEDYGKRLAGLATEIAKSVETKPDLSIGFARGTPDLPPLTFPEGAKQKFASFQEAAKEGLPRKAEIQLFTIGQVVLVGLPGEPILEVGQAVEHAVAARARSQAELGNEVIAVGLSNDYIGYLVNEKEYAHGGYEVESRSYYGPGLGKFLAEQAGSISERLQSPK